MLGRRTVLRATAPDCRPPIPGITTDSDTDDDDDDDDAEVIEIELELEIERFMASVWLLVVLPP